MTEAGGLGVSVVAGDTCLVAAKAALGATAQDAPIINDAVRVRAARYTLVDEGPPAGATRATLGSSLRIDTE